MTCPSIDPTHFTDDCFIRKPNGYNTASSCSICNAFCNLVHYRQNRMSWVNRVNVDGVCLVPGSPAFLRISAVGLSVCLCPEKSPCAEILIPLGVEATDCCRTCLMDSPHRRWVFKRDPIWDFISTMMLYFDGFSKFAFANSLRYGDVILRHRTGSTLARVMARCLTAPSRYLNQCWLTISKVQWHSSESDFTRDIPRSSISIICLKFIYLKFHSNVPDANELLNKPD